MKFKLLTVFGVTAYIGVILAIVRTDYWPIAIFPIFLLMFASIVLLRGSE